MLRAVPLRGDTSPVSTHPAKLWSEEGKNAGPSTPSVLSAEGTLYLGTTAPPPSKTNRGTECHSSITHLAGMLHQPDTLKPKILAPLSTWKMTSTLPSKGTDKSCCGKAD
jgi:hypothetical protein